MPLDHCESTHAIRASFRKSEQYAGGAGEGIRAALQMPGQVAEQRVIAGIERVEESIAQHRRGAAGPGRDACGHVRAPQIEYGRPRNDSREGVERHILRLYTGIELESHESDKKRFDATPGCVYNVSAGSSSELSVRRSRSGGTSSGLSLSLDVPAPGASPSFHHYRKSRHGYRYS